jgi:hypothetical protein
VHAPIGIDCVTCHGGDASLTTRAACVDNPEFLGVPAGKGLVERCGTCHSDLDGMQQYGLPTDQLALFKRSPHGQALFERDDPDAPTCASCHGSHGVLPVDDSDSPAYRTRVPDTCARCHADQEMMARHDLPADVFEKYARSAHGKGLLEHRQLRLPNCGDCHGTHGARPAGVKEVVNVCGNCHLATRDYFRTSPHHAASERGLMNECTTCHGHHDVPALGNDLQGGWDIVRCTRCHDAADEGDPGAVAARKIDGMLSGLREGIRRSALDLELARGEGIVTAEEEV